MPESSRREYSDKSVSILAVPDLDILLSRYPVVLFSFPWQYSVPLRQNADATSRSSLPRSWAPLIQPFHRSLLTWRLLPERPVSYVLKCFFNCTTILTSHCFQFAAWTTYTDGHVIGADSHLTKDYISVLKGFASLSCKEGKDHEVRNR